ncbi:FAD-binding protein [Mycobacterium palustre]|uniref:FAD-binding protein n=1 Tax=Mycobacterium palustre TaxID=153971 RepID=UPI00269129D4|nr:FAD-binding protein [Mycobacterium palustre]
MRALRNVTFLDGHDAVRLTSTRHRGRVTGLVLARRDSGAEQTLEADLVVDATGRGSRTPLFLEQLGYGRPREDTLMVHGTYSSRRVQLAPGTLRENFTITAAEPRRPTAFAMFAGEDDMVSDRSEFLHPSTMARLLGRPRNGLHPKRKEHRATT